MTEIQVLIGKLLSAAIQDKKFFESVTGVDWEEVFEIAQIHQIQALIYSVIKDIPPEAGGPGKDLLQVWQKVSSVQVINQVLRRNQARYIIGALKECNIPVILVKGPVIQDMYPKPEYRGITDIDILVRDEHSRLAIETLQNLGYYVEGIGYKHAVLLRDGYLTVEIHAKLLEDYFSEIVQEWEKSVWNRVIPVNMNGVVVQTLPCTDHLLFLCLHMASHFMHAGFGVRMLCDLVVYIKKNHHSIDWELFFKKTKEMGIDTFVNTIFKVCGILFRLDNPIFLDSIPDEDNNIWKLIDDIFAGGIFGLTDMARFMSGKYMSLLNHKYLSQPGRIKRLRHLLFPPYRILKQRYTYVLSKPYLTPIAWIHRIASIMFKEKRFRVRDYRALFESQGIYEERYKLLQWMRLI